MTLIFLGLEGEGFQVLTAKNGQEALDILHAGVIPNVIFLDLMMPVMNGWEFLQHHSAHPHFSRIPVVVCSALHDQDLPERAFLRKPVDLDDLVQTAQKYSRNDPGSDD
ncbi:MAG: response regulator [Bdellovibrionaceae bacterium]|nr:response regulator [Pseudobdellovibrionaceae bacterium]MBX3034635.1 response regulator [Pseudobdellovibrionaceae bacterium]